jgi:hypothetical protein
MIPAGESNYAPTPVPAKDYRAIERLEILIDNATTIEELNGYGEESKRLGLYNHLISKYNFPSLSSPYICRYGLGC